MLIEIGNTAVKAAWADGSVLGKTFRYQGEKVMQFIASLTDKQVPLVMTVVSARVITPEEQTILQASTQYLILLDPARQDALSVFDLGTTLTVDYLDSSGRYLGGNISLGCRTRFKALNRYSKSLPLVDMPSDAKFPGDSQASSIESGVISGIIFEIDGYIRTNPENIVIFTGGDAIYFAKRMKNSIFVVCNLGLMGLAIITDDYVKKNIQ